MTDIVAPQDGELTDPLWAQEITAAVNSLLPGYRFLTRVYFTSSGSFTKATYPGLRAIFVRCQGSGGAGGGAAATGVGESSAGSGARGGGYAEKFVLAGSLSSSETVTVGAGGTGASGTTGGNGAQSSFGAHCSANGGAGGGVLATGSAAAMGVGQSGVVGTNSGDLSTFGGFGQHCFRIGGSVSVAGSGGDSQFSGLGRGGFNNGDGTGGINYGGGGGGALNGQSQSARPGGNGGNGIVIVDIYV